MILFIFWILGSDIVEFGVDASAFSYQFLFHFFNELLGHIQNWFVGSVQGFYLLRK